MIHRFVVRDKARVLSEETLLRVLVRPIVTEKSTLCKEKGHYVFEVASWATKFDVARAVESIFGVGVRAVNTLNQKGTVRRFRGRVGVTRSLKKAMVSLKKGAVLDLEGSSVS